MTRAYWRLAGLVMALSEPLRSGPGRFLVALVAADAFAAGWIARGLS